MFLYHLIVEMEPLITLIGIAIVAFVSTNVDDAFVLVAFFSDRNFSAGDVVVGQYGGMAAMYVLSLVAVLISVTIPAPFLGLLGLIPIAIGIKKTVRLWRSPAKEENFQPAASAGTHRRILTVAGVTVANGGDNIATYSALFANLHRSALPVVGLVFALMTGAWCVAAFWLVKHRALGAPLRGYANRVVPFVLIGLGFLILIKSGVISPLLAPGF
jgi:cadmium resistance protein CadD (predicted permease)